jgi:pimeloyl-ACP methyl ester carboxylesterase
MLILAAVYAGRGLFLAWMVGGTYRFSELLVDCTALAFVILSLRLLDAGVGHAARRLIGDQTNTRKACAGILNWAIIFLIAAPFVIALAQFHPQKIGCGATPAALGLPYTNVVLRAEGMPLAGWHLPASSPERPVVMLCHGLGANKQNFLPMARLVHGLDFNVLIFDFRGHGDSGGRTVTFGYKESDDVQAAVAYARAAHPTSKLYGLGYSMGGSALIKLAAEQGGFDKIVLDCTFARAEHIALHSMLWFFGPLKRPIWHTGRAWGQLFSGVDVGQHNPEEHIGQIRCPIFLIHGSADTLIPATESQRLLAAAGQGTQLWIVEGAGHLEAVGDPEYRARLQSFFEQESSHD